MATMIDPPSGWLYGFPKPIPEDRQKDTIAWLVEQGYPKDLIDSFGEHFYCRYWEETEKEKAIIKFNNDNLALLCSMCRRIIKTGIDFNEEENKFSKGEIDYLEPLYCKECKND
jgi:hypothetical protein